METITPTDYDFIHNISVDFEKRDRLPIVYLTQYDDKLPLLAVKMFRNDAEFAIKDDMTARIRFGKNDRTFVMNDALGVSEDKKIVYFEITAQMTVNAGEYFPVIEIAVPLVYQSFSNSSTYSVGDKVTYNEQNYECKVAVTTAGEWNNENWEYISNQKVACSCPIRVRIDRNPIQEGDIESTVEWKTIQDAIAYVESLIEDITLSQSDWDETDTESLSYIRNKPTIPTLVQSDWNESNTSNPAYIKNKPTIPTLVKSNWNESDTSSPAYIENKPNINSGVGDGSLVGGASSSASEKYSLAFGLGVESAGVSAGAFGLCAPVTSDYYVEKANAILNKAERTSGSDPISINLIFDNMIGMGDIVLVSSSNHDGTLDGVVLGCICQRIEPSSGVFLKPLSSTIPTYNVDYVNVFEPSNTEKVRYSGSFAFGQGLDTRRNNQFVCGEYNSNTESALFIVGNGDYNAGNDSITGVINKSNAFTVYKNGNINISGSLSIGNNTYSNFLFRVTYDNNGVEETKTINFLGYDVVSP